MTAFVHTSYPRQHPGVSRAMRAAAALQRVAKQFTGARATASMLLAAIVSALLVGANQVIETWTDGHLLMAWITLWLVAFGALALLAAPARRTIEPMRSGFRRWLAARKQAAEDARLWEVALTDARVMADLSRAMSQQGAAAVRRYY